MKNKFLNFSDMYKTYYYHSNFFSFFTLCKFLERFFLEKKISMEILIDPRSESLK